MQWLLEKIETKPNSRPDELRDIVLLPMGNPLIEAQGYDPHVLIPALIYKP
jgi:hypothetical protein